MRREPAFWVLTGTVVLLAWLMPPSLLIVGLALLIIGIARKPRRKKGEEDSEFAARFHELEKGIVSENRAKTKSRLPNPTDAS
jgi:cytochrome c-type biogenesis protein CcmH/NrfF